MKYNTLELCPSKHILSEMLEEETAEDRRIEKSIILTHFMIATSVWPQTKLITAKHRVLFHTHYKQVRRVVASLLYSHLGKVEDFSMALL